MAAAIVPQHDSVQAFSRQTHIQKLPDLLLLDIQKFTGGVYVYNYAKY